MSDDKKSGGVNFGNIKGNVTVGGDVVGGDKVTTTTTTTTTTTNSVTLNLQVLAEEMKKVNEKIDALPDKDEDEKAELKETVKKIEEEVKKGEAAKPEKLERWLKTVALMSKDIFDVAAAALTNPALGAVEIVKKVVKKAQEGASAITG